MQEIAVSMAGLIGLIGLSLGSDTWTLPPAILWTGVALSLFPLAIFFLWVRDYVPPVWSLSAGASIPVAVFAYAFSCDGRFVPASTAAQAGVMLHVGLMIAGSASR
jgi:hypothetical protein